MRNQNSTNKSLWLNFIKIFKNIKRSVLQNMSQHRRFHERMQLTFIYFFATIVLSYSVQGFLGGVPEFIFTFFPGFLKILQNPYIKLLANPEKTFILYIIILEILMSKASYTFSLLVKFNILLIFILEMFQGLFIAYWDIFLNREIDFMFPGSGGTTIGSLASYLFTLLYIMSLGVYFYSYSRSFFGKFPSFPSYARFITDSVAFWLQIKVPDPSKKRKPKK